MTKPNLVIYIAGYGRSGSTVLDLALTAVCRDSVGCGEVGALPKRVNDPRLGCSCGHGYTDCEVWAKVLDEQFIPRDSTKLNKVFVQDGILGFFRKPSQEYLQFWSRVFGRRVEIKKGERDGGWIVIDSTKTTFFHAARPVNLLSIQNVEMVVVHLKRNLSGVFAARRKGTNSELAGFKDRLSGSRVIGRRLWWLVVPAHWMLANLFAAIGKRHPDVCLYIDVQFEEFRQSPERTALDIWQKIATNTGRPLEISPTTSGRTHADHIVEGNRLVKSSDGVSIRGR